MDFEDAFFNTDDFILTEEFLGDGTFGKVFVAQRLSDKKKFAAKIINAQGLMNGSDQQKFLLEAQILHQLDHPAIVKFHGINFHSFENATKFEPTILTEHLQKGSLQKVIDEEIKGSVSSEWNATKKYICLIGIAHAMQYLHSNRIIHRDLKPRNVLLDNQFRPYVCDFGISRCFTEETVIAIQKAMTGFIGTPAYMAPELFYKNAFYGASVDVYAFAITAYQLITGQSPWKGNDVYDIILKVKSGVRPKINSKASDKMKSLIERCWSQNPYERPTFGEIFCLLTNDFTYSKEKINVTEVNNYIKMLKNEIKVKIEDNNDKNSLSSLLFDITKLNVGEELGRGIVGTFYKAVLPGENGSSSKEFTLKILNAMSELKRQREFLESIEIQSSLRHSAILQLVGISMPLGDNNKFATVTEFAPNGSLRSLLDRVKAGKAPQNWETIKAMIIFGIASAIAYIHQSNVVLGDLRSDAVFLDLNNKPKIGGFVNAIKLRKGNSSHNASVFKGVYSYMAPELFKDQNHPFNHKIDVYAYGMVLYEIFTLRNPFDDVNMCPAEKFFSYVLSGERPKFEKSEIPDVYAELIKSCWNADPDSRPSILSIVQHFITDKDKFFNMNLVKEKEFNIYIEETTKDLAYW